MFSEIEWPSCVRQNIDSAPQWVGKGVNCVNNCAHPPDTTKYTRHTDARDGQAFSPISVFFFFPTSDVGQQAYNTRRHNFLSQCWPSSNTSLENKVTDTQEGFLSLRVSPIVSPVLARQMLDPSAEKDLNPLTGHESRTSEREEESTWGCFDKASALSLMRNERHIWKDLYIVLSSHFLSVGAVCPWRIYREWNHKVSGLSPML